MIRLQNCQTAQECKCCKVTEVDLVYFHSMIRNIRAMHTQWRPSQVKSGGINIEKIEGVRSGEGLCPPQLVVWGLAPEKKIKKCCAKNYEILSKFWYFFPILQQKVGDYPPVLKVGDLYPCPLPLLRRLCAHVLDIL